MRILHAKPENACAKMSEFGSFCVHHVALNGEAVKSNKIYGRGCTFFKFGAIIICGRKSASCSC